MEKDLICVYNEETGLWEESPEPFAIVEYTTEEDFEFMKAAVEHYEKHGKWELLDECSNDGVYCSVCHKKVYRKEYANQEIKSKYCPNCGAKMMDE